MIKRNIYSPFTVTRQNIIAGIQTTVCRDYFHPAKKENQDTSETERCEQLHSGAKPKSVSGLMRPFDVINCRAIIDPHHRLQGCGRLTFIIKCWLCSQPNSCLLYLHITFIIYYLVGDEKKSNPLQSGVSVLREHLIPDAWLYQSFTFAVRETGCAVSCGVLYPRCSEALGIEIAFLWRQDSSAPSDSRARHTNLKHLHTCTDSHRQGAVCGGRFGSGSFPPARQPLLICFYRTRFWRQNKQSAFLWLCSQHWKVFTPLSLLLLLYYKK